MTRFSEVNVFSVGDSEKISTWSNVPYFFVQALVDQGIRVNRINIQRSIIGKVLNRTVWRLLRLVERGTTYDYFRSKFHFGHVRRKIAGVLQRHPEAQANIFLTFTFSSVNLTDKPTVLFCDWTYDHYLKYFANREPDRFERAALEREDAQIEGANAVFVLFPGVAEYMRTRYRNPNIFYLGNVVNAAAGPDWPAIRQAKATSQDLLFIGGIKYRQGALLLIEAFKRLRATLPALQLHIVGIGERELDALPQGVHCYGYLDKAREADRRTYYGLLERSRMLINPTAKWGAFSAALEAMHFYTPIVTSPYREFVETFGSDADFGAYCSDHDAADVADKIVGVLDSPAYEALCVRAHERVKGFTWDAYVRRLLSTLESCVAKPESTP